MFTRTYTQFSGWGYVFFVQGYLASVWKYDCIQNGWIVWTILVLSIKFVLCIWTYMYIYIYIYIYASRRIYARFKTTYKFLSCIYECQHHLAWTNNWDAHVYIFFRKSVIWLTLSANVTQKVLVVTLYFDIMQLVFYADVVHKKILAAIVTLFWLVLSCRCDTMMWSC